MDRGFGVQEYFMSQIHLPFCVHIEAQVKNLF